MRLSPSSHVWLSLRAPSFPVTSALLVDLPCCGHKPRQATHACHHARSTCTSSPAPTTLPYGKPSFSHLLSMLTRARARRPKKHFYHFRGMPCLAARHHPMPQTARALARRACSHPMCVTPAGMCVSVCLWMPEGSEPNMAMSEVSAQEGRCPTQRQWGSWCFPMPN